jgi:hypothetical protein
VHTFCQLRGNSNIKIPKKLQGSRLDIAAGGHVHMGLGQNNDIECKFNLETDLDLWVTYGMVRLNGDVILEDGVLKV